MVYNPNEAMNQRLRAAGNRSRSVPGVPPQSLPNIGQTPAVQAADIVMGQQPVQAAGATGAVQAMAAPNVQPTTFAMSPVGSPADPNHYNYEPQPDGAWRVYPPGVPAPPNMQQASLPRAASTADYRRMREAFMQPMQQAPAPATSAPLPPTRPQPLV